MAEKNEVINRLKRAEGQIKGIIKMVEEDKFCGDILVQIAASRAALNNAGGLILENYMKNCLQNYIEGMSEEQKLDELVQVMIKYTKQN